MEDLLYSEASNFGILSVYESYIRKKIDETTRRVKDIMEAKLMKGENVDLHHLISMTIVDVFSVPEAADHETTEEDDVIQASNHDCAVGTNVSLFQTRPNNHDMTSSEITEVENNMEEQKLILLNEIMCLLPEVKRMKLKKLSAKDEALSSLQEAMLHFWL